MRILHSAMCYVYFNTTEGMLAVFEQAIGLYFLLFQILKRFIIFKLFMFLISYSFIVTLPQIKT
jgi:hypothetical protein